MSAADRARIAQARARKARRLAQACRDYGITADQALLLDEQGREALAGLADVRTPSDETWGLVVERLREESAA
jgi:transposase-like protein